jgi:hypothetical protein
MDRSFKAKTRNITLDPADLAVENLEAIELDQHMLSDPRPLDQLDPATVRREIIHPDAVIILSNTPQRDIGDDLGA